MLYSQHRNKTIRVERPTLRITEISKIVGEEWQKLSESQKEKFNKKAQEAKIEYDLKLNQIKSGQAGPVSTKTNTANSTLKPSKENDGSSFTSSLSSVESNKNDSDDSDDGKNSNIYLYRKIEEK